MEELPRSSGWGTLFCLVRHGATEWNAVGRAQGHTDVPLNDQGRAQAREVAAILARSPWDEVCSSDLSRASETASIIGEAVGIIPALEPGLRERQLGAMEGLTRDQMAASFPWSVRRGSLGIPLVEGNTRFHSRIRGALHRLALRHHGSSVIVVTHGGFIAACLTALCSPAITPHGIDNCSTTLLHYKGLGRLAPAGPLEVSP